jgi:hypothetical protein
VRYIHLNPVRGKILAEPDQLDGNPYTGHGVILGKCRYDCQDVDGVLRWFGNRVGPARKEYRSFVTARFQQGVREELRGGGLIRSAGGRKQLVALGKKNREKGDDRILGSGDFVERMLEKCGPGNFGATSDIESILADVCRTFHVSQALVLSGNRVRQVSAVRRHFFLRAHEEAGASYTELGRMCGLTHTSVRQAVGKARWENERRAQTK